MDPGPDGKIDQIALRVKAQLLHDLRSVHVKSLGADAQGCGSFFDAIAFGQQLENLSLPWSQDGQGVTLATIDCLPNFAIRRCNSRTENCKGGNQMA